MQSNENDRWIEPAKRADAEFVECKYGELADIYAANRAEAAAMRGAKSDAEHWLEVESAVDAEQVQGSDDSK